MTKPPSRSHRPHRELPARPQQQRCMCPGQRSWCQPGCRRRREAGRRSRTQRRGTGGRWRYQPRESSQQVRVNEAPQSRHSWPSQNCTLSRVRGPSASPRPHTRSRLQHCRCRSVCDGRPCPPTHAIAPDFHWITRSISRSDGQLTVNACDGVSASSSVWMTASGSSRLIVTAMGQVERSVAAAAKSRVPSAQNCERAGTRTDCASTWPRAGRSGGRYSLEHVGQVVRLDTRADAGVVPASGCSSQYLSLRGRSGQADAIRLHRYGKGASSITNRALEPASNWKGLIQAGTWS